MSKVFQLAVASLREHPLRLLLTSLATISSACLVVWVVSGYDTLLKSYDVYADLALGEYPLAIAPIDTSKSQSVPAEVLRELRADESVATVDPMWLVKSKIEVIRKTTNQDIPSSLPEGTKKRPEINSGYGAGPNALLPDVVMLGTNSTAPPFDIVKGDWIDKPTDHQVVLRQDTAERFQVDVGDSIRIGEISDVEPFQVVGIMSVPVVRTAGAEELTPLLTPSSGEVFVSRLSAEQTQGQSAENSFLGVALQPDVDMTQFRFGWSPRLSRYSVPVQFQESIDIEEALDEASAAANVKIQAYATTGIAMLVALLVILNTLSMGVSERIRQFAILRAIVFTRAQIALLISIEAILLATIGFVGGVLLGWFLLQFSVGSSESLNHREIVLGQNSLLLAAVATYGGAIIASIIPAYRATRVRPVDAMSPQPQLFSQGHNRWIMSVVGVLLISVNPILTFLVPPDFDESVFITITIGFTSMAFGFVLIAPSIVSFVERYLSPILSKFLCIDSKLLASQLTSHTWRTVGAAISMSVGMSLFVSVQVWGTTMLDAFIPGSWAPDALIAFQPYGIPPEAAMKVAEFDGVDSDRCLPIVVEQPRLLNDITGSADRASITRQDNVIIVGIDMQRAFSGPKPLFDVQWTDNDRDETFERMKSGRGCLVPDHFLRETGLEPGKTFQLVPPESPTQPVSYTIAGTVHLPGWHWQTKPTGFRSRTHRACAIVFAGYQAVATDFNLPTASYVWFSYDNPDVNIEQITSQARELYSDVLGTEILSRKDANPEGPSVSAMPVERIRGMILGNAGRWIWMLSQIPLISAAIACLGVLNLMLASVRARRWEMGVMRSIGITKWSLVRAILAEGILIGIVACLLSLGFGIMAGWCGSGIAQYISFFGGLSPDLVIPWGSISAGLMIFLAIVTAIMLWPALKIGRTSPYRLMQEGRGTF